MRAHIPIAGLLLIGLTAAAAPAEARPPVRDHRQPQTVVRVRVPRPTVRVRVAPPVVRTEVRVRAPSPRHHWVDGYWRWGGRRYVWVSGRWSLPPRGYRVWVQPQWVVESGTYVFHPGYWNTDEQAVAGQDYVDDGEDYGDVDAEPPPPQQEVIPVAPAPDHVWVAGHWGWTGGRYVWVTGRWVAPRPGARWEAGGWERVGPRWHWRRARWHGSH